VAAADGRGTGICTGTGQRDTAMIGEHR
jgi:hypothetical protein